MSSYQMLEISAFYAIAHERIGIPGCVLSSMHAAPIDFRPGGGESRQARKLQEGSFAATLSAVSTLSLLNAAFS